MTLKTVNSATLAGTLLMIARTCCAADPATPSHPPGERRAFFGELHLHTAISLDAWTYGTKLMPDDAYRFGRGETIRVPAAQVAKQQGIASEHDVPAKRAWALDFMAVTDHSESMGTLLPLDDPNSSFSKSELGKQILAKPSEAQRISGYHSIGRGSLPPELNDAHAMRQAWDVEVKAANDNYQPGRFTTFIAYEWSAIPNIKNLHRNVIFNGNHAPLPFSSDQSNRPEDLWKYLESVRAQGMDVLAIPHNANASGGLMFDWNDSDGKPIDEAYAQRRALNEPLTEIVQIKGQSETVPTLSPNDEFANFEIYDHVLGTSLIKSPAPGSYVRDALGRGLIIQSKVGANPFKYGLVGASDIHNGLSTSAEDSFAGGHGGGVDPKTMLPQNDTARRMLGLQPPPEGPTGAEASKAAEAQHRDNVELGSGGLTGVWAEENTRESIFAALKRKETFATSGSRIRLRLFGGWGFEAKLLSEREWPAIAYSQGVSMGADLPVRPAHTSSPTFVLQAAKDPDGANLDRIQVIKVWLEGSVYQEKIYDVAVSGGRKIDPRTGRAPPVGNTVDLRSATYENSIGAPILSVVWRDPQFDPAKPAVYYARVLEIPTPRWSTLLAVKNHLPLSPYVQPIIQERAWSSPIWYTPVQR
jgi:Protein of unknown function (DUF3604)